MGQEHARPTNILDPVVENQKKNIRRIWNNELYKDFGIERIIRLTLAVLILYTPGLRLRARFEKSGLLGRKLIVESYVLLKVVMPVFFFLLDWTEYWPIALFCGIMALETVIYLGALIFLSSEFAKPISYRRSLAAIFINYIEIGLNYAVIYSCCGLIDSKFFNTKRALTDIEAIYFSFATAATVGYGDITAVNWFGQVLVVTQIILFLVFAALFINFFASKAQDLSYYNSEVRYDKRGRKQVPLRKRTTSGPPGSISLPANQGRKQVPLKKKTTRS